MTNQFDQFAIDRKPVSHGSFWIGPARDGFTAFCAQQLQVPVPVDETASAEATQRLGRRQDALARLVGIRQAKSNGEIRHAIVVGNN